MYSLKLQYESRRGFTLVELILFMAISSMLMLTFFSVLTFNLKSSERSLLEDEMLLNGRYIIEYIKEETAQADRIIPSYSFSGLDEKFPTNIGFVIVNVKTYEEIVEDEKLFDEDKKIENKEYKEKYCNYSTYYFKDNKVIRIAVNKVGSNVLPYHGLFRGYNEIAGGVLDTSSITLKDNNLVEFDLSLGKDKKEIINFKSTISLRCPVVR